MFTDLQKEFILTELKNNGGFSLKGNDLFFSESGFSVSLENYESVLNFDLDIDKKLIDEVSNKFQVLKDLKLKNALIGGWKDKNKVYIDVSLFVEDKKEAIKQAKKNNQLAIYDFKNKVSIYKKEFDNI